jgi:hypothetical protein
MVAALLRSVTVCVTITNFLFCGRNFKRPLPQTNSRRGERKERPVGVQGTINMTYRRARRTSTSPSRTKSCMGKCSTLYRP